MGIFTRLRDIVGSNINAMLDKAEDPEKLIRLMIQEMEDTLVEIKASCAGAMATRKRIARELGAVRGKVDLWDERAELALSRSREDLAREALVEKARYSEGFEALEREDLNCADLVEQYQRDIAQLEEKLASAREKHRVLVRRHVHAQRQHRAQNGIRRVDTTDAWVRFEQFENRIERMEAGAALVNAHRKSSLEHAFAELDGRDDVEEQLEALRDRLTKGEGAEEAAAVEAAGGEAVAEEEGE